MEKDNFCIHPLYVARSTPLTHEQTSGAVYWTASRIRTSHTYQWGVYALVEREVRRRGARSVVDVGCGPAPKLATLHERNPSVSFVGIDQRSAIDYCRQQYPWGQWLEEDLARPTRTPSEVKGEVVVCADVIEHVVDPDVLLEYLRQRVEPGGVIVISTPDRDRLRGPDCRESPNPQHVREWSSIEFQSYLTSRGFRIVRHLHQLPVRLGLNLPVVEEVLLRAVRRRPLLYNQVCVAALP